MEKLLIGSDPTTIALLLIFIIGLLTKRFVPWWVYQDVLDKLKAYEDATPELVREMRRLMSVIDETEQPTKTDSPRIVKNPKVRETPQRIRASKDRRT